ncbi:hypothetical protein QJS66_04785 [Kocuria rhizophila]|nr:hypothetical protein QJS66_04785 [Kocuria rhizophila]
MEVDAAPGDVPGSSRPATPPRAVQREAAESLRGPAARSCRSRPSPCRQPRSSWTTVRCRSSITSCTNTSNPS